MSVTMMSVTVSPTLHIQCSGPTPKYYGPGNQSGNPGLQLPLRLAAIVATMQGSTIDVDADPSALPGSAAEALRELFDSRVRSSTTVPEGTAEFALYGDPQPTDIRRPETWKPNATEATALAFQVGLLDRDASVGLDPMSATRPYEISTNNGLLEASVWVCFNLIQEVTP